MTTFAQFCQQATGFAPYPYQEALASAGLPDLLRAPTGTGKTVAAVLPWLYRRRVQEDATVRAATPRWLVLALPLRTLVDQVSGEVAKWLDALGMTDDVGLHVLMGGGKVRPNAWRDTPARDAVLIGSIDMLLSRALNRGYAASRGTWPIDFGMLNNGTQWVFDEVQLFGPALPTTRQLQAFRDGMGTMLPTRSMWMSATVDDDWLETVDNPAIGRVVEVDHDDRADSLLAERLSASRTIEPLGLGDPKSSAAQLARAVESAHRPGTLTLVFCNTVKRAQETWTALGKAAAAPAVLVHSRFRPADRQVALDNALAPPDPTLGTIVVTTQALEAGVDISAATVITQTAPWSSIVQRAGRCNRDGKTPDARLLWFHVQDAAPYAEADVEATAERLRQLQGQSLTGEQLAAQPVAQARVDHAILRRKDVIELFDTAPDLSGNDVDVSPYIRLVDDRDVYLAWRNLETRPDDDIRIGQQELCPAPIGDVRKLVKSGRPLFQLDYLAGRWVRAFANDLRPGLVLLAAAEAGMYDQTFGWNPASKQHVVPNPDELKPTESTEEASDEDALSKLEHWVTLVDHLADAQSQTESLITRLGLDPTDAFMTAAVRAAALHDIGKAHPAFQDFLHKAAGEHEDVRTDLVWAKSSKARRSRHSRKHFSHGFVGALMLMTPQGAVLVEGQSEPDLVRYLVASHHGRVRAGVRPLDGEDSKDCFVALGVWDQETPPSLDLGSGQVEVGSLQVATACAFGGPGSWARLALELRDRSDLGIFRLGLLEALVRLGDWAASAQPSTIRTADGNVVTS